MEIFYSRTGETQSKIRKFFTRHFIHENSTEDTGCEVKIKQELNNYLCERTCSTDCDPLKWWAENGHRFPILKKMAKEFLGIPCTVVPRPFSEELQKARARLHLEDVTKIGFLHSNLKIAKR